MSKNKKTSSKKSKKQQVKAKRNMDNVINIKSAQKESVDENISKKSTKFEEKKENIKKNKEKTKEVLPNFADLNKVFENNMKIYNKFVDQYLNQNEGAKNITGEFEKVFNIKQDSSNKDWLSLIAPTANKIILAVNKFSEGVFKNPEKFFSNYQNFLIKIAQLNFYFVSKTSNQNTEAIIKEDKTDKRFSNEEWDKNLFFDFIKQFYLITAEFLNNLVNSVEYEDKKQKELMKFYIKQINAAFSPSNFLISNPEALRKTFENSGENLKKGMENFNEDKLKNPNTIFISQTDFDQFKVGKNLATTEGDVIFKNNIFELIHYKSRTKNQFIKPLLIIPPFINKFYIMDLNEKKSMVSYLLENNLDVYLMSWKNPKSDSKDFGFEEYINDGVLKAIEISCETSNSKEINLASYCVGGTLTSMTLAHLNSIKFNYKVNSATFFASLINFENPGELGIFISEEQIQAIEQRMNLLGYFDGKDMAATFNFLRPDSLYWNYVVNNYLFGNKPVPFDMLYWNSDSTRIPAKLHSDYLRSCYLNNKIIKKQYQLNKNLLDLKKIKIPILQIATTEDHIAPWSSVYSGLKYYGKKPEFILANSGHIAGIIQGKNAKPGKQHYFINSNSDFDEDSEEWLKKSKKVEGSWWPKWIDWLKPFSGEAKKIDHNKKFKKIYNAPGKFVLEK